MVTYNKKCYYCFILRNSEDVMEVYVGVMVGTPMCYCPTKILRAINLYCFMNGTERALYKDRGRVSLIISFARQTLIGGRMVVFYGRS